MSPQAPQENTALRIVIADQIAGRTPINFLRPNIVETMGRALLSQRQFANNLEAQLNSLDKIKKSLEEAFEEKKQGKTRHTVILYGNPGLETWKVSVIPTSATGKPLEEGQMRLKIELDTEIRNNLAQNNQQFEWDQEYNRDQERIRNIQSKIVDAILAGDPSPWM